MKYQVQQNKKPCASYGFGNWRKDTFYTKLEALIFATHWCYPFPIDKPTCAEDCDSPIYQDFFTEEGKSCSIFGDTSVMMRIVEIENGIYVQA